MHTCTHVARTDTEGETMSEDRFILTFDEAIAMLPEGEHIHTFVSSGFLIGADWMREEIIDGFRNAPDGGLQLSGEVASSMGHGLCFWHGPIDKGRWVFVETKKVENHA